MPDSFVRLRLVYYAHAQTHADNGTAGKANERLGRRKKIDQMQFGSLHLYWASRKYWCACVSCRLIRRQHISTAIVCCHSGLNAVANGTNARVLRLCRGSGRDSDRDAEREGERERRNVNGERNTGVKGSKNQLYNYFICSIFGIRPIHVK